MAYSESFLRPGGWTPPNPTTPWQWNPAQTFVDAYNGQKESQMKLEQAALDRELQAILLPMKVREAELNLAKLEGDVKLKSAYLDRAIVSTKQSTRAYEDAVRNGGAGQDPNAPTIGRWSAARYVGQPAQTTTPAASPKPKLNWSVVKPAATSTGP